MDDMNECEKQCFNQSIEDEINELRKEVEALRLQQDVYRNIEPEYNTFKNESKKLNWQVRELSRMLASKNAVLQSPRFTIGTALYDVIRHPMHAFHPINKIIKCIKRKIKHSDSPMAIENSIDKTLTELNDIKSHNIGKRKWLIKCPAYEDYTTNCGDYHFCIALAEALIKKGECVEINLLNQWEESEDADIVLVLRGLFKYVPRRRTKTVYVLWNISHPEDVSDDEYNSYDIVFVSSNYYAKILEKRVKIPVYPLLQCTDTKRFYIEPNENNIERKGILFIGNARPEGRLCVNWASASEEPLRIYGKFWNEFFDDYEKYLVDTSIENNKIRDEYIHAKATLNEHWSSMQGYQFINNRIFDALACGLPVISDSFTELREMFPDAILYYEDEKSFRECLDKLHDRYQDILSAVDIARRTVVLNHTFDNRADFIINVINNYQKNNFS